MLYPLYSKQPKKRSVLSYIGWTSIPVILGAVLVGFLTNTIDDAILFAKDTIQSIPLTLQEMRQNSGYAKGASDDRDYLAGIPIKDILRGGNKYVVAESAEIPKIDAESYVVGDVLTGEIILEKNSTEPLPVASLTKLMTASVALDELKDTHVATVSQRATLTESSRGMLKANEKIEVSDLLYPLLLVSSNDAAEVLAETFGRKYFIQSMNRRASEIGMTNTEFDDPSGLSEHNISTARDLFLLSEYLFNTHSNVFEITKLKEYTQGGRSWKNANRFAGTTNYEGGKTGYTSKAHRTGVALFTVPFEGYGDRVIAISLLRTDNRTEDYNSLLAFLNNNVSYRTPEQELISKHNETTEVSLAFMGDLMFDRGVKTSVTNNFAGDYTKLFENLGELKDADIAFANLEGPISDGGKNVGSKYSFRFEPVIAKVLKDAGIDVVSFANNHVGDWSLVAFKDTLTHLTSSGVLFTGAGSNKEEAKEVTIIESKGIKIGFLAFSDVGPDWIKASETQAGQLLASDPNRLTYIEEAKKKVNILVVSYHWGDEYKQANERQKSLARSSIDSGATLVIGHHPHVIQETEIYKNGLIAYSLGNGIFDQHFSKETMEGMLLTVSVTQDGIVGHEEKIVELSTKYQPQKPVTKVSKERDAYGASVSSAFELEQSLKNSGDKNTCPKANSSSVKDFVLFNANKEKALSKQFVPEELIPIPDDLISTEGRTICLNKEVLVAFYEMYKQAKEDGVDLVPTSGYRSFTTQEYLFDRWEQDNQEAEYLAIAKPGHSEHHLGTTLDLTSKEIDFESASSKFKTTASYEWLTVNASKYGFVQSYTEGREDITGYIPESWHWRYLGAEHATAINHLDLSIVEYLDGAMHAGG